MMKWYKIKKITIATDSVVAPPHRVGQILRAAASKASGVAGNLRSCVQPKKDSFLQLWSNFIRETCNVPFVVDIHWPHQVSSILFPPSWDVRIPSHCRLSWTCFPRLRGKACRPGSSQYVMLHMPGWKDSLPSEWGPGKHNVCQSPSEVCTLLVGHFSGRAASAFQWNSGPYALGFHTSLATTKKIGTK